MLVQQLIRQKRDGEPLQKKEIQSFITGVTQGTIPDYQIAAMLMAIFFRGLSDDELASWADAMLHSGEVINLDNVSQPKVDKHSTGGVGDKISIPLAPAVAACGVAVPMVSGRGLGHTGGTLDKLESIPGFRVDLDIETFRQNVATLGICLIGQTKDIAPADKRLYALRDVTGTVESIPLIASSIMSKKLAEGIDALVLDVKVGAGAFMKDAEQARALFRAMKVIGAAKGKKVTALLSKMDAPIGTTIGNALEIAESIEVLKGGGPSDTVELTVRLGAEMLLAAGVCKNADEASKKIEGVLQNGAALEKFREVVSAQGGDPKVVDSPSSILPKAKNQTVVKAKTGGKITSIDAYSMGIGALHLGAGRAGVTDVIDPAVGIETRVQVGQIVQKGDVLVILHENGKGVQRAVECVEKAYAFENEARAVDGGATRESGGASETLNENKNGNGGAEGNRDNSETSSRILEVLR